MESGCRPPGGLTADSSRRAPCLHRGSQARESVPGQRLPLLPAGGRAAQREMSAALGAGPGAATATRGSAHQVRRVDEAADWWSRGEGRAHGGRCARPRGCGPGPHEAYPRELGCVLGARSWGCRAEEKGLLPSACGSQGSLTTRTYLSSRPRTVSGASGLGPRIAVTQRVPQTIGAPAACLALPLAGFSFPS